MLFVAFAVLGVVGCGGERSGDEPTAFMARAIATAVENSFATSTYEIAEIARGEGAEVLVAETGPADPTKGAYESTTLVVRLTGEVSDSFGVPHDAVACWEFEFSGRFQQGDETTVPCPEQISVEASTTTLPTATVRHLEPGTLDLVAATLDQLTADERASATAVQQRVAAAVSAGPAVWVAESDGVIGVTVWAGRECVMARLTDPVEVWVPMSADATAEGAGCSAIAAVRGDYQTPP